MRTATTEQRRTIEARLDRLKARAERAGAYASTGTERDIVGVLKGTLDLLTDVLLEDDHG